MLRRRIFAFLSLIIMLFVMTYQPTVYGNDAASIERYIMKEAAFGWRNVWNSWPWRTMGPTASSSSAGKRKDRTT